MQDKTVPYYPIIMVKPADAAFPHYTLPPGYRFQMYTPKLQAPWCQLVHEVGPLSELSAVEAVFAREFLPFPEELAQRCLFVLDPEGIAVATATLWFGDLFSEQWQRIHWVMVSEKAQGKGLAKALLSRLLLIYGELGLTTPVYLTSETWSYKATNLYGEFGFTAFREYCPPGWQRDATPQEFLQNAQTAWAIIEEKLSHYGQKRP